MDTWPSQSCCCERRVCVDHGKPAPTSQLHLNTPTQFPASSFRFPATRRSHGLHHPQDTSAFPPHGAGVCRARGRPGCQAGGRAGLARHGCGAQVGRKRAARCAIPPGIRRLGPGRAGLLPADGSHGRCLHQHGHHHRRTHRHRRHVDLPGRQRGAEAQVSARSRHRQEDRRVLPRPNPTPAPTPRPSRHAPSATGTSISSPAPRSTSPTARSPTSSPCWP